MIEYKKPNGVSGYELGIHLNGNGGIKLLDFSDRDSAVEFMCSARDGGCVFVVDDGLGDVEFFIEPHGIVAFSLNEQFE